MARYRPSSADQPYTSVEFLPQPEGNRAFFHLRNNQGEEELRARLAQLGQTVEERTTLQRGTMLVTHGPLHETALRKEMDAHVKVESGKAFNAWKLRGAMGFTGQIIQMFGVLSRAKIGAEKSYGSLVDALPKDSPLKKELVGKKPPLRFELGDKKYFNFVFYNLIANTVAYTLGSAIYPDPHRMRQVKQIINERLVEDGATSFGADTLPDPKAALLPRHRDAAPTSVTGSFHGFMQRNSNWFETGLRVSGAYAFFSKGNQHGQAMEDIRAGHWREGLPKFITPKWETSDQKLAFISGALILPGKALALMSSTPDHYNGQKPGLIRTLRDKVFFRLGGVMETIGYGINTYGAFTGKGQPDGKQNIPGIIGFGLFTLAYAVRWWAPVGKRKVDMEEIYTHAIDAVAKFPADRQCTALAKAASVIVEEFDEQKLEYGKVHARLRAGMLQFHNIGIAAATATPAQGHELAAQGQQPSQAAQAPALSDDEIGDLADRLQNTDRQQKILSQFANKEDKETPAQPSGQKPAATGFAATTRPQSRPAQETSLLSRAERSADGAEFAASV